jgi:FHS family L-fucose permease-like MFS transporter
LIFGPIAGGMFFYSKNAAGASTGSETLWVPYAGVAVVVIILAVIFYFANVPDIKAKDDFHMDDSTPGVSHSIWSHPHFVMAVIAQFLYVAAQAGIFSFFINYMTSQVPDIPTSLDAAVQNSPDFFKHWMNSLTEIRTTGAIAFNNKGASNLVSVGLLLFLGGRFIGTALLRKFAADFIAVYAFMWPKLSGSEGMRGVSATGGH